MTALAFYAGCLVGCLVGVAVMALLQMAGDAERQRPEEQAW